MSDIGICAGCGSNDEEVELNEAGLCADCAAEDTGDGLGAPEGMSGDDVDA